MAKIRTLRRCALLRDLDYRELAILAPHMKEERRKAQELLAEEGAVARGMIILKSGKARVSAKGAADSIEIGADEFVGELSLGSGQHKRAVGVSAVTDCEYLLLEADAFEALSLQAPDVAAKIARGALQSVSEKLVQASTSLPR